MAFILKKSSILHLSIHYDPNSILPYSKDVKVTYKKEVGSK